MITSFTGMLLSSPHPIIPSATLNEENFQGSMKQNVEMTITPHDTEYEKTCPDSQISHMEPMTICNETIAVNRMVTTKGKDAIAANGYMYRFVRKGKCMITIINMYDKR